MNDQLREVETKTREDIRSAFASGTQSNNSFSPPSSDEFQPGTVVSESREPRKGKLWHHDKKEVRNSTAASQQTQNDTSSTDETVEGDKPKHSLRKSFKKIGSVFHRNKSKEKDRSELSADVIPST